MADTFVHLHNHTEYSLLDGAVHIKDLIAECSRMGMPAVAVTDHGNLFGAIELVMETNSLNKSAEAWNKEHPEGPWKQPVKPIFGCEVYLSPTPIGVKKQLPGRRKYTHLLLLAENETGWQNLVKMVSRSHLEGFYYKPRVDMETLREFHEGLICCTACLAGPLNEWLLNDQPEKALLSLAYSAADDGSNGYWGWVWQPDCQSGGYGWEENGSLDAIYTLLVALGYEMSDEEKALQNGTHAIFSTNAPKKADVPCERCKEAHPGCDKCCKTCDDHCNASQLCRKEYGE